jgi:hypothetical protein
MAVILTATHAINAIQRNSLRGRLKHFCSLITYDRVCNKSNTTGTTG